MCPTHFFLYSLFPLGAFVVDCGTVVLANGTVLGDVLEILDTA